MGDIRDPAAVRRAVDGVDVVFHNVAQVPLAKDAALLRTVNVDGTERAARCVRRDAGVGKVVHTSSSAVFGVPDHNPVLPTRPCPHPVEAYGARQARRRVGVPRAAADGLDVTIVRPRTILGHGRLGIFGILFDWIADGADIVRARRRRQPLPVRARRRSRRGCASLAGAARRRRRLQRRHRPVRHDARVARIAVRARRHRGSRVRSLPARAGGGARCSAAARLGLAPFAPYHWLMYSKSMWFDIDHARDRARLAAAVVERRDARRQLRLVRRQPRLATAGSSGSRHRRSTSSRLSACSRAWRDRCVPRATLARRRRSVALMAALAYVPALMSSPGTMPADTKLYLYLDPRRLVSDSIWSFDARQFAGWVPHQVIAYLWPSGPWYVAAQAIGLPDWVAHRLWIGTIMFAAGTGIAWAVRRRLGFDLAAAVTAGLVYQLSPYLVPYVSRTSSMLLPWAGLGWVLGLTIGAATRTRWRDAALCALVIATTGSVNATALAMVAPAPLLWLLLAVVERTVTVRRALVAATRIGVLAIGTSLWWLVMLSIQGRQGADLLAYSESLEDVSLTSTATEVWRGLGYWLTYVRDPFAPTTTAGADYMTATGGNVLAHPVALGFVLVVVGLVGLVFTRFAARRFAGGPDVRRRGAVGRRAPVRPPLAARPPPRRRR